MDEHKKKPIDLLDNTNLKPLNGKLYSKKVSIEDIEKLHTLGPLLEIGAEIIEEIEDAESGAYYLQGTIFYDNELHWCRITGWGVDNGITLVYYVPVTSIDLVKDEEHTTLTEILNSNGMGTLTQDSGPKAG